MSFTLVDALVRACEAALDGTSDAWIRLDCPPHYPVAAAVDRLPLDRVGVLPPFEPADFASERVSGDASEITRWRNEDAVMTTIVVGPAQGREEAGLRSTRTIDKQEVLVQWHELADQFLDQAGESLPGEPLAALIAVLLEAASEDFIDAFELDAYLRAVVVVGPGVVAAAGRNLPLMGLMADSQLLAAANLRARLHLNQSYVELLSFPPDGASDQRRLLRVANGSTDVARAAERFRAALDRDVLYEIDLEEFDPVEQGSPPRQRQARLLSAQKYGPDQAEQIASMLSALETQIPSGDASVDIAAVADGIGEVRINLDISESSRSWTRAADDEENLTDVAGEAPVVWLSAGNEPTDHHDDAALDATQLASQAVAQDALDGAARFVPLVDAYLLARARIAPWAGLLANDDEAVLELLIVCSDVRERALAYIDSWTDLLNAEHEAGGASMLRDVLPLLDARWGGSGLTRGTRDERKFVWARLAPFHPWRIAPLMMLATYARTSIGTERLGGQLRWALDRMTPVYPVLWTPTGPLPQRQYSAGVVTYMGGGYRRLMRAADGAGLTQIARSFVAYHPYAASGLVITLVNPPLGTAVSTAIRAISQFVQRLDIRIATTTAETASLDVGEDSKFVGRFPDLSAWASRSLTPSHLTVVFAESLPTAGAVPTPNEPLRGTHVSLRLEAAPAALGSSELQPVVTLVPRDENRIVLALRRSAQLAGADDTLMNLSPTLPRADIEALQLAGDRAEWLIVGVPGPIGVLSQADIGSGHVLIGRQDLGTFGLYVYAHGAYAVRRYMTRRLREAPIEYRSEHLDAQIAEVAERSPRQILSLARAREGVTEAIGVLAALQLDRSIATEDATAYRSFYLPIDEMGWTRHWLSDRYRADFLRVDIAREIDTAPRMRIRAIEAKGLRRAAALEPSLGAEPWVEAAEQVRATIDSLATIYDLGIPDVLADIRFTSFCEHLFAIAIADLSPLGPDAIPILRTLSDFAARNLEPGEVAFDGLAAATAFADLGRAKGVHTHTNGAIPWPISLIRGTAEAVNSILTGEPLTVDFWSQKTTRTSRPPITLRHPILGIRRPPTPTSMKVGGWRRNGRSRRADPAGRRITSRTASAGARTCATAL